MSPYFVFWGNAKMGLKKKELDEIVPKIINGDNDAFSIFQKEYGGVVTMFVKKYLYPIQMYSYGMYDFEDITQEIWLHILKSLPNYDSNKSQMITWLYMICEYKPNKILRNFKAIKRRASGDKDDYGGMSSLNETYLLKDDGKELELMDFIADPNESLENKIVTDFELYEYIYALKDFIKTLTQKEQVIYLHSIKGITQMESAALAGVTQVHISRVRHRIYLRIFKLSKTRKQCDLKKSAEFVSELMLKNKDEITANKLEVSLAVIKICREILRIANMY